MEDTYKVEDFAYMQFNVMLVPKDRNIMDSFPLLKQYDEFNCPAGDVDKNSLLRYICLLYDRKTPLLKNDNLVKRKIEAAEMAGFTWNEEGVLPGPVDRVMKGRSQAANNMIIRIARIQGNTKFAALVTGTEAYYTKLTSILNSSAAENKGEAETEKIKGDLWKQAKEMEKDLSSLAFELLNEDNNPYLKEDLFSKVDSEASQMLMLSPEKIANGVLNPL